jgi:hypothetical protein
MSVKRKVGVRAIYAVRKESVSLPVRRRTVPGCQPVFAGVRNGT